MRIIIGVTSWPLSGSTKYFEHLKLFLLWDKCYKVQLLLVLIFTLTCRPKSALINNDTFVFYLTNLKLAYKRNDLWFKQKGKSHKIIQCFSTFWFGGKLNQNHNNEIISGWAQDFKGRKLTEVGSLPGTATPPCFLTRPSRGIQQQPDQGINYKNTVADSRAVTTWTTPPPIPRTAEAQCGLPYLRVISYYSNWSHLGYPSSKIQWLTLGCGSELAHFPSTLQALCFISALRGERKSIKSGDSPWRLLNKQLFTPGRVLSTRILKHGLKNDMPCLAKFI